MATIDARQQQFFATTAEWQANDIVLLSGEMGFELRDDQSIVAKVGDGVTKFSLLTAQTSWVIDTGSTEHQTVRWKNGRWTPTDSLHLEDDAVRINNTDLKIYDDTNGEYLMKMVNVDGYKVLAITSATENMGVQINARTAEGTAYSLKCWPNGDLRWNNKILAGAAGPQLESGSSITDATIHGVITGDCNQFSLPSAGAGFATVGAANLASEVGAPCKIGDFGVIIPDTGAAAAQRSILEQVAQAIGTAMGANAMQLADIQTAIDGIDI